MTFFYFSTAGKSYIAEFVLFKTLAPEVLTSSERTPFPIVFNGQATLKGNKQRFLQCVHFLGEEE